MSDHGYIPYKPNERGEAVLRAAKAVLSQYDAGSSPMTVRQVFYRLVQEYGYPKDENAYGSLVNYMARSRRAYMHDEIYGGYADPDILIPFHWVRDEKGKSTKSPNYDSVDDFLSTIRSAARSMTLDRMVGQEHQVELWCEAAGMVPLMSEIARPYGVRVSSGGGYDSVTAKHRLAERVVEEAEFNDRPTTVLHIGDFDPSGEGMYETLTDDVGAMVNDKGWGGYLDIERVALTEQQVIDWDVVTAPPKPLDSRRRSFLAKHPDIREHLGSDQITAQLEAFTPPDLRRLMEGAIEQVIDREAYDEALKNEGKVRAELLDKLKELNV